MACGQGHEWLWWPYRSPAGGAGHWPHTWHRQKGAGNKTDPFWHRWKPMESWRACFMRGNKAVNVTVHMMTSWQPRFITTQMDDGELAGFLLLRVVTNARRRPRPPGGYCPGTYGQLIELPESCMSRISVSMGVFPTRRMKKSCEMRLAGTARRAGRRRSRRPKRWGWLGYCILSYSVRATWAFSCRDSTWTGSVSPQASVREAGGRSYLTVRVWAGYVKSRDELRGWLKSQQLAC